MRLHDERASNEAEPPHLPEVEAGHDRLTGARSSARRNRGWGCGASPVDRLILCRCGNGVLASVVAPGGYCRNSHPFRSIGT
jgi:hypothetical protein